MNRIFFDTEFYEDGKTIELISIGLVKEDDGGKYDIYYAVVPDAVQLSMKTEWLAENVFPTLKIRSIETIKPRDRIARELVDFCGENPEFWAYYADYDWVALCQLYGRMIDLPKGWPMYCRDLKQLAGDFDLSSVKQHREHNALDDALWVANAYSYFMEKQEGQK